MRPGTPQSTGRWRTDRRRALFRSLPYPEATARFTAAGMWREWLLDPWDWRGRRAAASFDFSRSARST